MLSAFLDAWETVWNAQRPNLARDTREKVLKIVNYTDKHVRNLWRNYQEYRNARDEEGVDADEDGVIDYWTPFLARLKKDYPHADDIPEMNREELDRVVKRWRTSGIRSQEDLDKYTQEFRAASTNLSLQGLIAEIDIKKAYEQGFVKKMWDKMEIGLASQFPDT